MNKRTPFLPGISHFLQGRIARSEREKLIAQTKALADSTIGQLSRIFGTWIPEKAFECSGKGLNSRHRVFNLKTTFYCFLSQVLDPGASCREVLEKLRCIRRKKKLAIPAKDTSAYCQARSRLPVERLTMIHQEIRGQTQRSIDSDQLYQGREVKVVDGTGVSMPDTPENQKVHPQPKGQKAGCGFPVCGLVASFSLATGVLLDWVQGEYQDVVKKKFLNVFRV